MTSTIETTLAPWLTVVDAMAALEFYERALGAVATYRLDDEAGRPVVARLDVEGALFWVQEDASAKQGLEDSSRVRMIMTLDDPDAAFERAVAAGANVIAQVHEEHGWRTGRVTDPFGYDWEFTRPLAS